jgi:hypothetical protein
MQARAVFFSTFLLGTENARLVAVQLFQSKAPQAVMQLTKERNFDLREKSLRFILKLAEVSKSKLLKDYGIVELLDWLERDEKSWLEQDPEHPHQDVRELLQAIRKIFL